MISRTSHKPIEYTQRLSFSETSQTNQSTEHTEHTEHSTSDSNEIALRNKAALGLQQLRGEFAKFLKKYSHQKKELKKIKKENEELKQALQYERQLRSDETMLSMV